MNQKIAIIDENDNISGYEYKLIVHQKALFHRAFSVFVFNDKQEMLLQRRAADKYHSPGLWTNTCCSHLPQGEIFEDYIHKRMLEEMGFDCPVKYLFKFKYKVQFANGLWENEMDHVYTGIWNGNPEPNPNEVMNFCWINLPNLKQKMATQAHIFTYWFRKAMDELKNNQLHFI